MKSTSLFRQIILEHYKNPRNKGEMPDADIVVRHSNLICADDLKIFLKINNGKIADAKFLGEGCSLSQAGASMLTEHLKNMSIPAVKEMTQGQMLKFFGGPITPARLRCALLAYEALGKALNMV